MFEKLPDVLGKEFLTSFFAPMVLFVGFHALIFIRLDVVPAIFAELNLTNVLLVIGIISWFGGLLLNGINREIYRFLEGYGALNPLKVFYPIERLIYKRLMVAIDKIDDKYRKADEEGKSLSNDDTERRKALYIQRSRRFPIRAELVLPTPFGNRLRAFESYVYEMYGANSVALWTHLTSVMDEDFTANITATKNRADFWVNTSVLSVIALVELILLYSLLEGFWLTVVIGGMVVFMLFAYYRAQVSVQQWGRYFRAAFDIYLPHLWKKLGYPAPKNRKEEMQFWELYGQATNYRQPHLLNYLEELVNNQVVTESANGNVSIIEVEKFLQERKLEEIQGLDVDEKPVTRWATTKPGQ